MLILNQATNKQSSQIRNKKQQASPIVRTKINNEVVSQKKNFTFAPFRSFGE